MSIRDELLRKIKILNDSIWDGRAREPQIDEWLSNFQSGTDGTEEQRTLHALYLLSHFMYFGNREMRELMRVLFRDLYRYPLVEGIRRANGDTTDRLLIEGEFRAALERTLFLGVGNPSESGSHLLYYFRQENGLPKTRFIHSHEIFQRQRLTRWQAVKALLFSRRDRYAGTLMLREPNINRYVFIDDFCGSGHQGEAYSRDIVEDIKAFDPAIQVSYFVLCGTVKGMKVVRDRTAFDVVQCVFELDDTFRCFSPASRYFPSPEPEITAAFAEQMCRSYGDVLEPEAPLGYGNCQLLLGFQHNTPDNTLPVFWSDGYTGSQWTPMFRRYPKVYG